MPASPAHHWNGMPRYKMTCRRIHLHTNYEEGHNVKETFGRETDQNPMMWNLWVLTICRQVTPQASWVSSIQQWDADSIAFDPFPHCRHIRPLLYCQHIRFCINCPQCPLTVLQSSPWMCVKFDFETCLPVSFLSILLKLSVWRPASHCCSLMAAFHNNLAAVAGTRLQWTPK